MSLLKLINLLYIKIVQAYIGDISKILFFLFSVCKACKTFKCQNFYFYTPGEDNVQTLIAILCQMSTFGSCIASPCFYSAPCAIIAAFLKCCQVKIGTFKKFLSLSRSKKDI